MANLRLTLLQCRNPEDPMRQQEVNTFRVVLNNPDYRISAVNILTETPDENLLKKTDAILVGGSGDYSVLENHSFLPPFFNFLKTVCEVGFPTFASCFGFQAICQALGGEIIRDKKTAEVGTYDLYLTEEGKTDELFGELPTTFPGQMGHKDRASVLPPDTIPLAYSEKAPYQAYKLKDKPIYATQFHPELTMEQNRERFENYIEAYSNEEVYQEVETIRSSFRESKETYSLLPSFIEKIVLTSK